MLKAIKQHQQLTIKITLIGCLLVFIFVAGKWGLANLTFKRAEQLHTQLVELTNYQHEEITRRVNKDDIARFSHDDNIIRLSHADGSPQDPDLRQDDDADELNNSHPETLNRHPETPNRHPETPNRHPETPNRHPELDSGSYRIQQQTLYKNALNKITTAINLHNNPQYLEKKAQIIEWGAHNKLEPDYIKSLNQAKSLYLQSTELRPTWAGTWAALALIKWQLNEFDNELKRYLKNAHLFGKNSPEVHLVWAQLALTIKQSNNAQLINYMAPLQKQAQYHITQGLKHPRSQKQINNVRKISHQRNP